MEFKTPYSKRNKFRRLVWSMVWTCLARPFPRSMAMGTYVASCIWRKDRIYSDGVCHRPRVSAVAVNNG